MDASFFPLLLLVVLALVMGVGMILVGLAVGPHRNTAVKRMPYESGMDPVHDARRRFDIHFHLVAVAFLLFDVEILFLYPWSVAHSNEAGLSKLAREGVPLSRGLIFTEVLFFVALLAVGLVYVWRRGLFRWR